MRHIDPETLALLALGEQEGGPDADGHLRGCRQCTAEVARLREVVDLGRAAAPLRGTLTAPPPQLWDRIREGVAAGAARPPVEPLGPPPVEDPAVRNGRALAQDRPPTELDPRIEPAALPSSRPPEVETELPHRRRAVAAGPVPGRSGPARPPSGPSRRGRRRGLLTGLGALVVVLGATAALVLPGRETVATAALEPLEPGAAGTVALVEDRNGRAVRIEDPQLAEVDGYYEVWLASPELDRLVSLGPYVPGQVNRVPGAVDLAAYPVLDVSIEPVDGDPTHSARSVLRGTLPT
jgi:hypothetical protein